MATIFVSKFFLPLFLLLLLQQSLTAKSARIKYPPHKIHGFSLDLFHRDSPHSPLYDPTSTPVQRLVAAAQRSLSRHEYLSRSRTLAASSGKHGDIWTPGKRAGGNSFAYLMKMSIGTPPQTYWATLDTGSDLIWTQCLPCESCYNQSSPFFNPKKSSTYKPLDCSDSMCSALPSGHSSCDYDDDCRYLYSYADGTLTEGSLSAETLRFESDDHRRVSFPKIAIGCSHKATGQITKTVIPGIVGLGTGSLSLVSQLGSSMGNKFSYCLPLLNDSTSVGSLKFGDSAAFSGAGKVQRTPMMANPSGTLYDLTLMDISVAGKKLNIQAERVISNPSQEEDGDDGGSGGGRGYPIVIDSGTTLTMLQSEPYARFEAEMMKAVKYKRVKPPMDAVKLCYDVDDNGEGLPDVVFHFAGGADWRMKPLNVFARFSNDRNILCSLIVPPPPLIRVSTSLLGNIAQGDFHVEYDLQNAVLSFVPTSCSKQH